MVCTSWGPEDLKKKKIGYLDHAHLWLPLTHCPQMAQELISLVWIAMKKINSILDGAQWL